MRRPARKSRGKRRRKRRVETVVATLSKTPAEVFNVVLNSGDRVTLGPAVTDALPFDGGPSDG